MSKRKLKIKDAPAKQTAKVEDKVAVKPANKPVKNKEQGMKSHGIKFEYSGTSAITVARKSRTRIDTDLFNSRPDAPMTERDNAALRGLKVTYGNKQFERGDLDAGIIRRLMERGYLQHVAGDAMSPTAHYKLTGK